MDMPEDLVRFETPRGMKVEISKEMIKRYLCPTATDQELFMFLQLCVGQRLNPWLREAYCIKYGSSPATFVVGWHTFLARAEASPQFNGYDVEVYDQDDKPYRGRDGQTISHATAKVYRKDRKYPAGVTVLFREYSTGKAQWSPDKMPVTMIRKVALEQALREAFTQDFEGMYGPEEMKVDPTELSMEEIVISAEADTEAVLASPEAVAEPGLEVVAAAPAKPRIIAPFGVITGLVKLYGARWSTTNATQMFFGDTLKSSKDMEAFAARSPDTWATGALAIAEAVKLKAKS